MRPRRAARIRKSYALPPDLLEALEETADELVVSPSLLVEAAVRTFLEGLELPLVRLEVVGEQETG